ncbi:hypothetical protein RSAG8_00165, partial [Rhizoctonia solani AG-8 WAC10335]
MGISGLRFLIKARTCMCSAAARTPAPREAGIRKTSCDARTIRYLRRLRGSIPKRTWSRLRKQHTQVERRTAAVGYAWKTHGRARPQPRATGEYLYSFIYSHSTCVAPRSLLVRTVVPTNGGWRCETCASSMLLIG